jgi:1-phosphatidylinositol-3-phosphate 5-kinase
MSIDAWSVSFAKYLELRFYGQAYSRRGFDNPCPHSLHQDHQQYFAQHNVVAAFKYVIFDFNQLDFIVIVLFFVSVRFCPIQLWEISLPPCPLSVKRIPKSVSQLIEDVKSVAILGYGVYSNIFEVLTSLKENSSGLKVEGKFGHDFIINS